MKKIDKLMDATTKKYMRELKKSGMDGLEVVKYADSEEIQLNEQTLEDALESLMDSKVVHTPKGTPIAAGLDKSDREAITEVLRPTFRGVAMERIECGDAVVMDVSGRIRKATPAD
jgi:hypothetical protein